MARNIELILDSSVWIAFLHKEDAQHAKAQKTLWEVRVPVVVPEYVLLEVATTLERKHKTQEAQRFVQTVLADGGSFLPAGTLARDAADVFCKQQGGLSYTDAALVVLSRRYRVITFDAALGRAIC